MKYPDINIQIKYPNKMVNADTPSGVREQEKQNRGRKKRKQMRRLA